MRRRLLVMAVMLNAMAVAMFNSDYPIAMALMFGTLVLLKKDRVLLIFLALAMLISFMTGELPTEGSVNLRGWIEFSKGQAVLHQSLSPDKFLLQGGFDQVRNGAMVRLTGAYAAPESGENYRLRTKGIDGIIQVAEIQVVDPQPVLRVRMVEALRERADRYFGLGGPLVLGMALGDREGMDPAVADAFRVFGLSHLLVVSGFHIGIIGRSFERVFKRFGIPYYARKALTLNMLVGLLYLSGCGVSVLRAVSQYCFRCLAGPARRPYDSLSALAAISIAFLIVNPCLVGSLSYRLSFMAALAIGWLRQLPAILAVYLGILPMILSINSDFNLLTFPVNLLMIAAVAVALPPAMALLILPFKVPMLDNLLGMVFQGISQILVDLSSIESLNLRLVSPMSIHLLLYYGLLMIILVCSEAEGIGRSWIQSWKIWISVLILSVVCLHRGVVGFLDESLLFVDVGNGDGALITHQGRCLAVDVGAHQEMDLWLRRLGVKSLSGVLISHGHYDHYGGLSYLGRLPIECLGINEMDVLNGWELLYNQRESLYRGQQLSFGELEIEVLWPRIDQTSRDPNDRSQVLRLNFHGLSALFTGDITRKTEEVLEIGKVDLLKVAHHGAATSSSQGFLEQAVPQLAVVSVGGNNPYGHPDPEVLERLKDCCEKVMLTRDCGSILIKTDGQRIRYKWMRD